MIVLENRYGKIMIDDNKTHGYYIVKWYRPLHELQEDTDIFQSGDVFCNDTYLNPIQQANHWYNQITIKTVVRIQYVLKANIDLQKPPSSIKPPNACNFRVTILKGSRKLPDCLHKGLMDEIIRRGLLEFIDHEKDGNQYE